MKSISNLVKHPLFSGSVIMITGSNLISFLNYIYHLVLGRLLGPSGYGELAALISVMGLLGMIPGAISTVIIKYVSIAKNEKEVRNIVNWFKAKIFIFSLTLAGTAILLSPLIASFLHINRVSYLILIVASFFFSLQSGFSRSILQGLLKFKEIVLSSFSEISIKLVLSIILVYLGFQVNGAMVALVISAMLGWYITSIFLKYKPLKNINLSINTKSMLKFSFPVVIQTIALTSLYTSDVILVKHFFSSYDAGLYAALSTLGKIIFFGTGPINTVMFPLVSQRNAKGESYKKIFLYSFIAIGILSLGISIIYGLVPELVINLLFGAGYIEAKGLLVLFAIFISLFTLSSAIINYNLSLGKTKVTYLALIAAAAQIITIYLFHKTLFSVILISITVAALLLTSLLIYSIYEKYK